MRIFILGKSGSGKSTFAARLSKALGMRHVRGSEWVEDLFTELHCGGAFGDREERSTVLTALTMRVLVGRPDHVVEELKKRHGDLDGCVVDGLRNPRDFIAFFDPRSDMAFVLDREDNAQPPTEFDSGVDVFASHLDFLGRVGLLATGLALRRYRYRDGEMDGIVDAAVLAATRRAGKGGPAAKKVHAEMAPMRVYVRGEFLFGPDEAWTFHDGKVIGFSCYPGCAPTLKVRLDDGTVYDDLPPHAVLVHMPCSGPPKLGLEELVYHDCPSGDISVHRFESLKGPVQAYFKGRDLWMDGDYILTIDWYEGNDLLNMVLLKNGQFAFLPNHKIKFHETSRHFMPLKKQRATWKVA